jgi:hypothetical protein
MQVRHDAIDEPGRSVARRSRAEGLSTRAVFNGMLAALLVALALALAAASGLGFNAHAHGSRANGANGANGANRGNLGNLAVDASQDCSARYAALLDLAELARRDGKSSEVVVRGLSERGGAMSVCLPAGRSDPTPQ